MDQWKLAGLLAIANVGPIVIAVVVVLFHLQRTVELRPKNADQQAWWAWAQGLGRTRFVFVMGMAVGLIWALVVYFGISKMAQVLNNGNLPYGFPIVVAMIMFPAAFVFMNRLWRLSGHWELPMNNKQDVADQIMTR